ncbi:type I restriction enzyme HsdR N-terminal domain-containing protein [Sphingobium sp. Leaf26]|uniref:type I restriction enzyme HsdR N-terminal domain-containing protein n=1 Tax=Sphingobium sp. Leaf26 TaxID=1735693 RepID=UPI000AD2C572|nr:type I restriction enzyme HsdR N-terminal domain-containing protein [Sphingobium sp. Leaf26]
MTDWTVARLDRDTLLSLGKALEPLPAATLATLAEIERLSGLDDYVELDVREEIITPILRALGYRKESMFSVEREVPLRIAGKLLKPDYSLTLWEEDFWIVEAKRPSATKGKFGYAELRQAFEYAVHPEINAALLVLCDGHAIEVFDREHDLELPILRVERANLVRDFDQLRALLSPFQVWFFQKRRILRLTDKVFDREFNIARINEFEGLLRRRLGSKTQRVVENMRAVAKSHAPDAMAAEIRALDPASVIEVYLPLETSWLVMEAMTANLIAHCTPDPFRILYQIFPDHPRVVTDAYMSNSLHFLMRLEAQSITLNWTPAWLGQSKAGNRATVAIECLIRHCLTSFASAPDWQVVLLHAAAVRRLAKIVTILSPDADQAARLSHLRQRYFGDELCFSQQTSSPGGHALHALDNIVRLASQRFIDDHRDEQGSLRVESARHALRVTWQEEIRVLEAVPYYPKLLRERDLGELHPTESANVQYDNLGHGALCVIDRFPKWKAHILAYFRPELDRMVEFGSWQARAWLDVDASAGPLASEALRGERFFFGDGTMPARLASLYHP